MNFSSSGSFVIVVNPKGHAGFRVSSVMLFDILQKFYHNKFSYFLNTYYRLSFQYPEVRVGIVAPTRQLYVSLVLLLSIIGNCKLWRWVGF
jgi:hypothetical protein